MVAILSIDSPMLQGVRLKSTLAIKERLSKPYRDDTSSFSIDIFFNDSMKSADRLRIAMSYDIDCRVPPPSLFSSVAIRTIQIAPFDKELSSNRVYQFEIHVPSCAVFGPARGRRPSNARCSGDLARQFY